MRYNDGSLDLSFGTSGKVTTAVGASNDYGRSVTVQADGKILVAGGSSIGGSYDFSLVRYNANGSSDSASAVAMVSSPRRWGRVGILATA